MGQKSNSAWVWIVAGVGAVYAALSHHEPPTPPPEPPALVRAAIAAPTPPPEPSPSSADFLLVAKRLLLLTQTGQFRSRELHAHALRAIELIDPSAPEFAEAAQLRRGIVNAYAGHGATAPAPDRSRISADVMQALSAPIAVPKAANAPSKSAPGAAQAPPSEPGVEAVALGNALPRAPTPAPLQALVTPGCEENGTCYGDISDATGRPKTVEVHGYYRKNGTYVRGHYRSK